MTTKDVTDTNHEFESHCEAGAQLFTAKDKQYHSAYKGTGLLGVACEIIGICRRLLPLIVWDKSHGKDNVAKLKSLFLDIHNYAVMGLMCIEDGNWDGRKE